MVGALVVTHGRLSHELVSAAKKIVGEAVYLRAISIDWFRQPNGAGRSSAFKMPRAMPWRGSGRPSVRAR